VEIFGGMQDFLHGAIVENSVENLPFLWKTRKYQAASRVAAWKTLWKLWETSP
jgi:hypothetical protein